MLRSLTAPILATLVGALVLACGPGAMAKSRTTEDHAPIAIDGDSDLLLPDALAGNGVRGGLGIGGDPYRIADWRIVATSGPALTISGVTRPIVVENLEVDGRGLGQGAAIVLQDVHDLTLRQVRIEGGPAALVIRGGQVRIEGFEALGLDGSDPAAPWGPSAVGIYAVQSTLAMEGVRVSAPQGAWLTGALTLRDVFLTASEQGLRIGSGTTSVSIAGLTARASACGAAPAGIGVHVDGADADRIELADVDVDCFGTGLWLTSIGSDRQVDVDIHGLRATRNDRGVTVQRPGQRTTLQGAVLEGNEVGLDWLDVVAGRAQELQVRRVAFAGNDVAIDAHVDLGGACAAGVEGCVDGHQQDPLPWPELVPRSLLRDSDFIGNEVAISFRPNAGRTSFDASLNHWSPLPGDSNRVGGEVVWEPTSPGPNTAHPPAAGPQESATPWLPAVLGIAFVLGARRRRDRA